MNGNGTSLGVNLAFTKFLFVTPARDDDAARTRLRAAGAIVARGFFNDFEAEGARDTPPHETIQFLVNEGGQERPGLSGSRYALQVSSKYRPRLNETEMELRRRLADNAAIVAVDGAVRAPHYTRKTGLPVKGHARSAEPGISLRNPYSRSSVYWVSSEEGIHDEDIIDSDDIEPRKSSEDAALSPT